MQVYSHLYVRHHYEGDHERCFYCGDARDGVDHVPPLDTVEYVTPEVLRKLKIPLVLIPSCLDCNMQLGAKALGIVEERLDYLLRKLQEKYNKEAVDWTEEEIKEMSPMFQRMIRGRARRVNEIAARINGILYRLSHPDTFPEYQT